MAKDPFFGSVPRAAKRRSFSLIRETGKNRGLKRAAELILLYYVPREPLSRWIPPWAPKQKQSSLAPGFSWSPSGKWPRYFETAEHNKDSSNGGADQTLPRNLGAKIAMQYFRFLPDPAKLRKEARWSGVSSVPDISRARTALG